MFKINNLGDITVIRESFEEKLKCGICNNFLKECKMLPCAHRFDSACLDRIISETTEDDKVCPSCNEKFKVENIVNDILIKELVRSYSSVTSDALSSSEKQSNSFAILMETECDLKIAELKKQLEIVKTRRKNLDEERKEIFSFNNTEDEDPDSQSQNVSSDTEPSDKIQEFFDKKKADLKDLESKIFEKILNQSEEKLRIFEQSKLLLYKNF